jgi:hypothetical protein
MSSAVDGGGLRYNAGKAPMEYIPLHLLADTARVLYLVTTRPENSYPPFNWARGMQWLKPYACLIRHMFAWYRGQDRDPDTGLPHLAHAMCNLLFLIHYEQSYPVGDDRPKEFFTENVNVASSCAE